MCSSGITGPAARGKAVCLNRSTPPTLEEGTGSLARPSRPPRLTLVNWAAWRAKVAGTQSALGCAVSSELRIASGRLRGRRRPDLLPLLPHPPSGSAGDLLCSWSARSTRASRQEAGRRAPLEGMGCVTSISAEAFFVLSRIAHWGTRI